MIAFILSTYEMSVFNGEIIDLISSDQKERI